MVTYMVNPQNKLTLGATELTNQIVSARVQRIENGFDSAIITLADTSLYPATVTNNTSVQLAVRESGGSYTTILKGIVRFLNWTITPQGNLMALHCDGAGYGLSEMLVGNEYGTLSTHPTTDTCTEIATDIVNAYTNKILDGAASGYSYTISSTNSVSLNYVDFPYKPADKCLNDVMDLVSAHEAGAAGTHWIVTTDDVLHIKDVDGTQAGWTKYYGDSQAAATLTYGTDYLNMDFEKLSPEANYVLYFGAWRRPSNGDRWTEPQSDAEAASMWDTDHTSALTREAAAPQVGISCLKATTNGAATPISAFYPHDEDAAWDFTSFSSFNVPYLNFYIYLHSSHAVEVLLKEDAAHYYHYILTPIVAAADTWYHVHLPVGPHYKTADSSLTWINVGADWSTNPINSVEFLTDTADAGDYLFVDGLYFGDAVVCRAAWNSDLPGDTAKMRLITDNIGKDDTLTSGTPGTTDVGMMAQFAYSELLRMQKTALVGNVDTPMIKDALPGQYFNIQGSDMRATKIVHNIDSSGYTSKIHLTDDLTNSRTRLRYEETNKLWADMRPEWQDRQASNMKAGSVNWRITRLVEDYA